MPPKQAGVHAARTKPQMAAGLLWRLEITNLLKLKAAFLATKAFLKDRSNITVCLHMHNTTAVAHVNNKGGTRSPQLVDLTLKLWEWCLQKSILITAPHLPGKLNNVADRESREFYDSSKWQIDLREIQPFLTKKVQCRSLCVTPNGSPPNLCELETRPGCYLHRCNVPRLVPSKRLCLSTIQSDRTSTEKSISGQSRSGRLVWPQCGRNNLSGQPSCIS